MCTFNLAHSKMKLQKKLPYYDDMGDLCLYYSSQYNIL